METNWKASIVLAGPAAVGLADAIRSSDRYRLIMPDGVEAVLALLAQAPCPDLIVLDATPGAGADPSVLLHRLKQVLPCVNVPVLALVGEDPGEQIARLLGAGAADVLGMPSPAALLHARMATLLALHAATARLQAYDRERDRIVDERTRTVMQMQDASVLAIASLAEARDPDVGFHIRRIQHYVQALARELRFHARFMHELTEEHIALLYRAAPLHDIGKVGVPDAILFKTGRLTDQEFNLMKLHTVYGRDAIAGVERTLGASNGFLQYAREICYSHQEKWDGSGYPEGLRGEQIPVSARLMAVADVYDALISKRLYRPAFSHETAVELIRQARGEHFDPDVVDAMLAIEETFMAIGTEFRAP